MNNWIYLLLFIVALGIIWIPWLIKHKIRPYFGKQKLKAWLQQRQQKQVIEQGIAIIAELTHANPYKVSKRSREQRELFSDEFLYGEINLLTLIKLLDMTNIEDGATFYDLGSGAGDVIFMADFCYNLNKAVGIELLPEMHQLSQEKLEAFKAEVEMTGLEKPIKSQLIYDNFLSVDFSDADVIFINATGYKGKTWDTLTERFKMLKPNTKIIVTSMQLNIPEFTMIYSGSELMSWGYCSVRIYQRV